MPRLVQHNARAPVKVETLGDGSPAWICQCGLSKNQPYCDGSHRVCRDESDEKLYEYDEKLRREELAEKPKPTSVYRLNSPE